MIKSLNMESLRYNNDYACMFTGDINSAGKSFNTECYDLIYKDVLAKDIYTLSNGKKVANFSSPHDFTFTDGTVLPKVSNYVSNRLKVNFNESVDENNGDVELSFSLSDDVWSEMYLWEYLHAIKMVDVVYCPLPMITAIKNTNYQLKKSPFRAIRMEDRIKKLVSIEKQCL